MLSIAIYSDNLNDARLLQSKIQDFLVENKILAKTKVFDTMEKFITVPDTFDIYFMDMDSKDDVLSIGSQMIDIDQQSYFVYWSSDKASAYDVTKIRANYFLLKPIEPGDLEGIMNSIKKRIKKDTVIIKTPEGDRRVYTNDLNYVNIVKRCTCYHLVDGAVFDGQTLRGAFEKEIYPLQEHPKLAFIPPSLLVNMTNIKILSKESATFENDDVIYLPKKAYDIIKNKWFLYNQI